MRDFWSLLIGVLNWFEMLFVEFLAFVMGFLN
jgi:hypothetical protein